MILNLEKVKLLLFYKTYLKLLIYMSLFWLLPSFKKEMRDVKSLSRTISSWYGIWYMFYNATCVKSSRWNCTCTGCVSYFLLDKALLLFIKLYITYLDYICFLQNTVCIHIFVTLWNNHVFCSVWTFNLQCKK